jgi:hypothetical protein
LLPAFDLVCFQDLGHSGKHVVVSHCFSLYFLTLDVEELIIQLFATCVSMVRYLLRSLAYFLIRFSYCWTLSDVDIFWKTVYLCCLQMFSHSWCVVFSFSFFGVNKVWTQGLMLASRLSTSWATPPALIFFWQHWSLNSGPHTW